MRWNWTGCEEVEPKEQANQQADIQHSKEGDQSKQHSDRQYHLHQNTQDLVADEGVEID